MVAKGYSYAAGQLTGTLEVYPMGEIEKDFTVILPEQVRTNADANVAIFKVDADLYPFGITLNSIQVTLLSNGTYTLGFREYTQAGTDAPTLVSYIETITLSSQGHKKVLEADITDKDIAAGNYIFIFVGSGNTLGKGEDDFYPERELKNEWGIVFSIGVW